MHDLLFYTAGKSEAVKYAKQALIRSGIHTVDHSSPDVTHLLLDIPTVESNLSQILETLPEDITIIGGRLESSVFSGYSKWDLLKDPCYLADNAAITARCALRTAAQALNCTFDNLPVMILGWGRIGKCLGQLLKALNAKVFICARKDTDRAMVHALGCTPAAPNSIMHYLPQMKLVFNTVPTALLNEAQWRAFPNCVKVDLASTPGILSTDTIYARGLPGKTAPESSGSLIARTILHYIKEKTS